MCLHVTLHFVLRFNVCVLFIALSGKTSRKVYGLKLKSYGRHIYSVQNCKDVYYHILSMVVYCQNTGASSTRRKVTYFFRKMGLNFSTNV